MSGIVPASKTIEIFSTFDELERIVDEAESFFGSCFTEDEKVYVGVLLASEAVTNAIEHGNGLDETKKVTFNVNSSLETPSMQQIDSYSESSLSEHTDHMHPNMQKTDVPTEDENKPKGWIKYLYIFDE